MPKVIYDHDAIKKVSAAIAKVNATRESVEIPIGKRAERKEDDYSPVTLYLSVSEDEPEYEDDEDEKAHEGRAGLYFSLFDADEEDLGGGCWTTALTDNGSPIPEKQLAETAKDVLDTCIDL